MTIGGRLFLFCALVSFCTGVPARVEAQAPTTGEARASRAVEAAARQGAPQLEALLRAMPKGGDLHMHLSGAVYAETFIREAAAAHLCVAPADAGTPAVPQAAGALRLLPPGGKGCAAGQAPAGDALVRQPLFDALVDSFSMRGFVPSEGVSGHDQFFATFGRFGALDGFAGEWLDEVAARGAAQNEQYLEVMTTPPFAAAAALARRLGWPAGSESEVSADTLAKLREALLAGGLRDEVAADRKALDDMEADRNRREHCGEAAAAAAACRVRVAFLYQVLRGNPPAQVFAQTLLGFEAASADPRFVGLNFVMPEDGVLSMRDYHLQMEMLAYLHTVYPKVHLSLHAGELAPGLVAPEGLRFHIREAVEVAHAERIGHGVDALYEDRPAELLKELAARHVSVEINLTSNDVILGVKGSDHPLAAYRAAGVPLTLSTDDEGVSRIDLTHEYVRAVLEQHLSYADLKTMARASLEHSFLPGESLWAQPDRFTRRTAACVASGTERANVGAGCAAFLKGSERASQQMELERRLTAFEAAAGAAAPRRTSRGTSPSSALDKQAGASPSWR